MENMLILLRRNNLSCSDFGKVFLMCPQNLIENIAVDMHKQLIIILIVIKVNLTCFQGSVVSQLQTSDAVIVYSAQAFMGNHK